MKFPAFTQGLALALVLAPIAVFAANDDGAGANSQKTPAERAAGQSDAGNAGGDEFSVANQLLFMRDHLTQTPYPARYTYQSTLSGAGEASDDYHKQITMTALNKPDSDAKHVSFLKAKENLGEPIDDIENARGNPLIMVFLQKDVLALADETGGHWRYFQKQMKLALEHSAEVEPVSLTYQGKPIEGHRITVKPYAADPVRRAQLGRLAEKTYEFILSDQVPGAIVELQSKVPAEDGTGEPQIERLTLESVEKLDVNG